MIWKNIMNEMERVEKYRKKLEKYLKKYLIFSIISVLILVVIPLTILQTVGMINNFFIVWLSSFLGTYLMFDFWNKEYYQKHYNRIMNDFINGK